MELNFRFIPVYLNWASQVALVVRNPSAGAGGIRDLSPAPGLGRSPGGGHGKPSIFAWRIPWLEEPGGLTSKGHKEPDKTEATEDAHYQN